VTRRPLVAIAFGVVLVAVVVVVVLRVAGDDDGSATPPSAEELVAPLTGVTVPEEDRDLLERPALAAKIDNHPDALPQWGIDAADIVIELRVEGISRFLAVFHSRDVGEIGPIRSARTSDPDLDAMFGRPLVAWSGANPATRDLMRSVEWIQDVSVDRLPASYRREGTREAPHNLVLDAPGAFAAAQDPVVLPTPVFEYRAAGAEPGGEPLAGMEVAVGLSRSQYVWDDERAGWLRWSDGQALTGAVPGDGQAGDQVAPANVVVLETPYEASAADARSPEAVTLGEGRAWVLTGGHVVEGSWQRSDRREPWTLTSGGAPIVLTPGSTWVALPSEGAEPLPLTAERIAALRG
jgi:hypothetical protein